MTCAHDIQNTLLLKTRNKRGYNLPNNYSLNVLKT